MTVRARVRHSRTLRQAWRDEAECMRVDEVIFNRRFDLWHMTGYALAAGATLRMMSMCADRSLQPRRVLHLRRMAA